MTGFIIGSGGGVLVGPGGGVYAFIGAAALTVSTTFTIKEHASATSAGYKRFGLPFAQGDVPSGYVPVVTLGGGAEVTDIQFDRRVSWPDGSLRYAVGAADFGSFTSLQEKGYLLTAALGSYSDTADHTWAQIVADVGAEMTFTDVWESEARVEASGLIDTTISSGTFRINESSTNMGVGAKFYSERAHTVDDLHLGTRGEAGDQPPVYTVSAADTNYFEAVHPTETALAGATGAGSKAIFKFPTNLNNYTADIADVINNATYVEQLAGGGPLSEYRGWQFAKDDTTTILDDQQIIVWYASAWGPLTNGNIEIAAKVVRPIWDVTGKSSWICDASFKIDTVEAEGWTDVACIAHQAWVACIGSGDSATNTVDVGRRHWQTAANMPSLTYVPNDAYWYSTGVVPPLDTATYPAAYSSSYTTVLPNWSMGHRQNLDETAGYLGRGNWSEADCSALMRVCQDIGTNAAQADDVKEARTVAYAGFHAPQNFRDSTNRVLACSADTPLNSIASGEYTADGLGTAQDYFRENTGALTGGYVAPTGGYEGVGATASPYSWCWRFTSSDDHSTNHTMGMYVYEGEPHFYDNVLDIALSHIHRKEGTGGSNGGRSKMLFNTPTGAGTRATDYSINTSNEYGTVSCNNNASIRKQAFGFIMQYGAWGLCADADPARNLFNDIEAAHAEWLDAVIPDLSIDQTDRGLIWENAWKSDTRSEPSYMQYLVGLAMIGTYAMTNNASFKAAAEILVKFPQNVADESCYLLNNAAIALKPYPGTEYEAAPELGTGYFATPRFAAQSGNSGTITVSTDIINYPHQWGGNHAADTLFSPDRDMLNMANATDYYALTPTGETCQVSTSSGGGAFDFTGLDESSAQFLLKMADWDKTVVGDDGWTAAASIVKGDKYFNIGRSVVEWGCHLGLTNSDTVIRDKLRTFANSNDRETSTWFITDTS